MTLRYRAEEKAEKYFNKVLKNIHKILGKDITNGQELHTLGKKLFGKKFIGVFPSDYIPKMKNGESCVVNLDDSTKTGSHWIAMYFNKNRYHIFDSFGRKTTEILTSFRGKHQDTDYDTNQKIHENDCGSRCLAWLLCVKRLGIETAMLI